MISFEQLAPENFSFQKTSSIRQAESTYTQAKASHESATKALQGRADAAEKRVSTVYLVTTYVCSGYSKCLKILYTKVTEKMHMLTLQALMRQEQSIQDLHCLPFH